MEIMHKAEVVPPVMLEAPEQIGTADLAVNSFFTAEEEETYHRGRNGNAGTVPHNTDVGTYRMSTGFEAILGALYLEKKEERIREIWTKVRSLQGE